MAFANQRRRREDLAKWRGIRFPALPLGRRCPLDPTGSCAAPREGPRAVSLGTNLALLAELLLTRTVTCSAERKKNSSGWAISAWGFPEKP